MELKCQARRQVLVKTRNNSPGHASRKANTMRPVGHAWKPADCAHEKPDQHHRHGLRVKVKSEAGSNLPFIQT